jgi:hypothetical protein
MKKPQQKMSTMNKHRHFLARRTKGCYVLSSPVPLFTSAASVNEFYSDQIMLGRVLLPPASPFA